MKVWKGESPDFLILNGNEMIGLEIREATTPRDQREMARAPLDLPTLIGSYGGRGAGGYEGDEPERQVAFDVSNAIRAKQEKLSAYRANCKAVWLGLYANGNPAAVVHVEELIAHLDSASISTDFERVSLLCGRQVVEWDGASWKVTQ